MAIKSSAGEKPEFCHPACNEDHPCRGKVCLYTETRESKSRVSLTKVLKTEGGISSEVDGPRKFNPSNSSKTNGVNGTVLSKSLSHLLWRKSHTGNYYGGAEKADGLLSQPQGVTGANAIGVIDQRFLLGVFSGIGLTVGLPVLKLAVDCAARKVLEGLT